MQEETTKKKSSWKLNLILLAVFLAVVAFKYFLVSGNSIAKLLTEYSGAEIKIEKYETVDNMTDELILNDAQKQALIKLFKGARFRAVIADTLYTADAVRYDISVNGTYGETTGVLMRILFTGGRYLMVSDMNYDNVLRLYGNEWNNKLENIMAMS